MWHLLLGSALAQELITDISEEVLLDVGGGWHRTVPADAGWHFLFAAGGDYNHAPLADDWSWSDQERRGLTGFTNLQDHAITRCPDGTWLHVASATLDSFDDSAYAFLYDASFHEIARSTLEERVESRKHNDPLVACTANHRFAGFTNDDLRGGDIFPLDATLAVGAPTPLDGAPTLSGAAALPDGDELLVFGFNLGTEDTDLIISRYDAELRLVESVRRAVAPPGQRAYWPQGALRVGDHVLVAMMARDDVAGWSGDTGQLWLVVLDAALNPVQSYQISQNTPPSGGMRPFISRRDDTLVLSYDREVRPRLFSATLDLDALGATGDDTGLAGDSGADPKRCGCATPAPQAGIPLALLALWRHRSAQGLQSRRFSKS